MGQVHKRFTSAQVRFLLQAYLKGTMNRAEIQASLEIGKTRFFALLKQFRPDPESFEISYDRRSPGKLTPATEAEIKRELVREKKLVEDPRLPISGYNYCALRDRLRKKGVSVSATTITARAKSLDCYRPRPKRKVHDREVLTTSIGALIQHDASLHLWSPYAQEKWTLITSIDDYSRKLLFADFFPVETTWNHIQAAQTLMESHGIPLRYYVDSLRIFRFIQGRDSLWRKHVLQTDEAEPQWKQVMQILGVEVIHALSPQAKGKVERPYGWMQDRIVRTCALENLSTLEEARAVLREEVDRYPGPPNQGRQQSPSPFDNSRDPQPALCPGPAGGQQPLPILHVAQALYIAQGRLLSTGTPHGERLPPHLHLRPPDRGA